MLTTKLGEPQSEHDRALHEWQRERDARGLPFSDIHWVDDDGNEVPPPPPSVSSDERRRRRELRRADGTPRLAVLGQPLAEVVEGEHPGPIAYLMDP